MSEPTRIKAQRLRIDLWDYARADEDLPFARIVADGIVEGLGDAWFDPLDGDPHLVSSPWNADYVGEEEVVTQLDA